MRTAVVYIKTQRWMFNQSCMNIFGLPHSWGKREFLFYMYVCGPCIKLCSDFEWRFGQNQSVNFLTSQNEKSSRPNDSRHLYFLCFIYLELEIFTSKVRNFFDVLSEFDSYFFVKSSNKNRTKGSTNRWIDPTKKSCSFLVCT